MAAHVPEPALTLTAVAAATIPDLGFFSRKLPGATFLKVHHGVSHAFTGIFVQALLTGSLSYFVFSGAIFSYHDISWIALCFTALLGGLSHIFLDWVMHNNGLPLLWPFTYKHFALPLILGVNPKTVARNCGEKKFRTCFGCQFRGSLRNPAAYIITIGGALGFFFYQIRTTLAILTLVGVLAVLLLSLFSRERARKAIDRFNPSLNDSPAYPGRARPDRWLFVKSHPDESVDVILAKGFPPAILKRWHFTPPLLSDFVEKSAARIIHDLQFAIRHLYPEVTVHENVTHINFRDLSYLYSEPMEIGSVKVQIDAQGQVINEEYQEVW